MKQSNSEQTKIHKNRFSVNTKAFSSIIKQKDFQRHNTNNSKMRSDDKLINFSEMIPKLLEKIKTKNSSRLNLMLDNNSFEHNSNSSELNDEDEPIKNEINNINIVVLIISSYFKIQIIFMAGILLIPIFMKNGEID